jgi:hypothetical protein
MTHRERLERKLELRREWAEKAEAASQSAYESSHKILDAIPFGQPILVGHHSEKRHRRDLERSNNLMSKCVERSDMAKHHEQCADGIEHALDKSIFSDDVNAVQELEIRIKNNETKREHMKEINRLYRKGDAASLAGYGLNLEAMREKLKTAYSWCQQPYPAYELSNLGGRITADRKRLESVKERQQRAEMAAQSENGVTLEQCQGGYVRVTFAEKPDRSILNDLKAAGFFWGNGSWSGKQDALPESVKQVLGQN